MKVQRRTRSDVAPCCMCVAAVSRRTYRSHTHRHRRPDKPAGLYHIVVRFPIQIIDERVRKQSVAAHAAPAMCQIMPGARGDTPRQTSAGAEAHAVQSPCASNVAGAASASRTKVVGHPASALAHVLARAAAVCAGSSTPSTSNRRQCGQQQRGARHTTPRVGHPRSFSSPASTTSAFCLALPPLSLALWDGWILGHLPLPRQRLHEKQL